MGDASVDPVRMHRPDVLAEVARELLALHAAGTTTMAETEYRNPVSVYLDPGRFRSELEVLFRSMPLAVALSCELGSVGSYRTIEIAGRPLVIVRGGDGVARAFLNVCRHRGALVVGDRGCSRRLTCPYHHWSYDTEGALVGLPGAAGFAGLDRSAAGLVSVPCEERHGIIWAIADADGAMDLDAHLGPVDAELAELRLGELHYVGTRDLPAACNWHVAMDTHTESYHFGALHQSSIAPFTLHDLNVHRTFGRHQRLGFGAAGLAALPERPEHDWDLEAHIQFVYLLFPNTSLLVTGDHVELFQVLPGTDVGTSITHQTYGNRLPIDDPDTAGTVNFLFDLFHAVVRDEDYPCAEGIQSGLASGANEHLIFGRNEPALHHLHRSYDEALGLD